MARDASTRAVAETMPFLGTLAASVQEESHATYIIVQTLLLPDRRWYMWSIHRTMEEARKERRRAEALRIGTDRRYLKVELTATILPEEGQCDGVS